MPVRDMTSIFIASKSTVTHWQQVCRTLVANRDFRRTMRSCKSAWIWFTARVTESTVA